VDRFWCKHNGKVADARVCVVCRNNGNKVRKEYDMKAMYRDINHCQESNAIEIPAETSSACHRILMNDKIIISYEVK
jgi:hypothetical protein